MGRWSLPETNTLKLFLSAVAQKTVALLCVLAEVCEMNLEKALDVFNQRILTSFPPRWEFSEAAYICGSASVAVQRSSSYLRVLCETQAAFEWQLCNESASQEQAQHPLLQTHTSRKSVSALHCWGSSQTAHRQDFWFYKAICSKLSTTVQVSTL